MEAVSLNFDQVIVLRQEGGFSGRMFYPRETVFSFVAGGEYFPYISVPGWPAMNDGMTVTALLKRPGDWKSLVGWVDANTGEIVGPSTGEILVQALFLLGWLGIGLFLTGLGLKKSDALLVGGVLFSVYIGYELRSVLLGWRDSKKILKALELESYRVRGGASAASI